MDLSKNNAVLVENWNFTPSFPSLNEKQVERPQVLETIKEVLTVHTPVVFLEGESGIGATNILANFVIKEQKNTFSVFLNPASRYSYSLEYVKVRIAEQLKIFVDGLPLEKSAIDESELSSLIHRSRSKLKGKIAYIVIDGLAHIPSEDESDIHAILTKALPIGVDCFRFIISGNQSKLGKYLNRVGSKPFQLMRFSSPEIDEFFEEFKLEADVLGELKDLCKGNPGRLSSIRRLLKSGNNIRKILETSPDKYLDFIALEYEILDDLSESQRRAIAVLAYSKQLINRDEVEKIAKVKKGDIDHILYSCTFIEQRPLDRIAFVSNSHRKYAETKLQSLQTIVNDLQIEYLQKSPKSDTALLFLPTYLQQRNQYEELIELLSNEHYYSLLDSTQSLIQLMQRAQLGLVSAHALNKAISVFQFSLQKSLFIDLSESNASKAEIDALVSIGKTRYAMHLAERAVTKISKLSLLSAYASGLKKRSKNVEPFIIDTIKELINEVELINNDNTSWQIAEDLIHIDPGLAADTLEKSLSATEDARHKDIAYSRLSIVASMGQKTFFTNPLEGKIKSKAIQEFTTALTLFNRNKNTEQIIELISRANVKNKIALLTSFIASQRKRDGLLSLISYALDIIVKDSTYIPKAKDYADLAAPLRYQESDHETLSNLIGRFDGQIGLVKGSSVTRDWVRLNTSIAYAEAKYDPEKAYSRLMDAYFELGNHSNIEIRSECYARLSYALHYIDPNNTFEEREGLKAIIDDELKLAVSNLTEHTATQHDCIESILPAMVEYDAPAAIALAGRLNTSLNRDRAYQQIAELLIRKPSSIALCKNFRSVVNAIEASYIQEETIISCTNTLAKIEFDKGWAEEVKLSAHKIKDIAILVACKINIYKYYRAAEPLDSHYLIADINKLLEQVNATASRNDICFKAVEALSESHPEEAETIYQRVIDSRSTLEFENPGVQRSFLQCLALVIRAFGSALKHNLLNDSMLLRLANAIGRLTSAKQQMSLYTDLACRAWIVERSLQKIVEDYCRPLLEDTKKKNFNLYQDLLEIAFPALFVAHQKSALSKLSDLSPVSKNAALYNACELLRRRMTKYDPIITDDSEVYSIDYYGVLDILTLIEEMDYDSAIYQTIERLARTVSSKKNKSKITALQRKEISEKLISIISSKLPDNNNIKHEGYVLCAKAKAYSLTDTTLPIWQGLIDQAEIITNVADKAYVQIEILKSMPAKFIDTRKNILEKAKLNSDAIPSLKDKLGRLEIYSLACKDLNSGVAKSVLKDSLKESLHIENAEDAAEIQKSLIDAADQIEPGYADVLLELFDDDPAREYAKRHAQRSVEILKAKKSLADCNGANKLEPFSDDYLSEASWRNLSSLLANRITTKSLPTMASYMSSSSNLGLGELYPLLCWYIENASRKYVSIDDAKIHVLPLCEVLLTSTELALSVVSRKAEKSMAQFDESNTTQGMIIRPDDREAALNYVQDWLNQNCVEYIKFCDPYFTKDDLEIIQAILAANPECRVHILACATYLNEKNSASNEAFEKAWQRISEQTPPLTYIYGIGKYDGKELIHDRWILSKGAGLRIGTSLNSIGNKYSEISVMSASEIKSCEDELDKFLGDQVIINGTRIKMTRYQL
ncbi:hypothetical protein EGJ52_24240 [Pseudomonas luteola]|uniref:hypothetical protein n=1 Tax=Pseudomonas luteola TaxID=47886 RepID=UPI000F797472|nr:hypothetical protein [Pseudomonas luteola]RRW39585.1 hypothetical protein EGJ52_24240 [Pseudomonas luteola]